MFEYLPLKAGELTGRLSFSSSELGVYQYDLNLTATPAGTEAPVHFRAGLGTSQSQTCRFVNFAKSKVEYSCKVVTFLPPLLLAVLMVLSSKVEDQNKSTGIELHSLSWSFEPQIIMISSVGL